MQGLSLSLSLSLSLCSCMRAPVCLYVCVCVCVCVCACVCVWGLILQINMILNVVLVNKLYLRCELIWSNCIISYTEAAWSSVLHLCVILGGCYNYYELRLFLCVFIVSAAAVYLRV